MSNGYDQAQTHTHTHKGSTRHLQRWRGAQKRILRQLQENRNPRDSCENPSPHPRNRAPAWERAVGLWPRVVGNLVVRGIRNTVYSLMSKVTSTGRKKTKKFRGRWTSEEVSERARRRGTHTWPSPSETSTPMHFHPLRTTDFVALLSFLTGKIGSRLRRQGFMGQRPTCSACIDGKRCCVRVW